MSKCTECKKYDDCRTGSGLVWPCGAFAPKLPMTNADRIRAMSDEELMDCMFDQVSYEHVCAFCVPTMRVKDKCDGHCRNGILKWLQQPAEEVDKDA